MIIRHGDDLTILTVEMLGCLLMSRGCTIMKTRLVVSLMAFASYGIAAPAMAAPPRLIQEGTEKTSLLATAATSVSTCKPQGSVSRSGSIVTARLDFIRA